MLKREKTKTEHGWYSQKQYDHTKGEFWTYSNTEGHPVQVTMISEAEYHGAKWDDMIYVGEVVDFIDYNPGKEYDPLFFGMISNHTLKHIQLDAIREKAFLEKTEPKRGNHFNFWV